MTDVNLLLSAQRALLGAVLNSFRAVSIGMKEGGLAIFRCVFEDVPTTNDRELLSTAATELLSDFPDNVIEEDFIVVPFPKPIPQLINIIFQRHEHDSSCA
jgi:hypothetical protein